MRIDPVRLGITLLLAAAIVPAVGTAQKLCQDCVIGLYDDPGLLQTSGRFDGDRKTLYLGVRFAFPYQGMTSIELSVSGISEFLVEFEELPEAAIVLGNIAAPEEPGATSGGINVAWSRCQEGSRILGILHLISLAGAVGNDIVLRVQPRFPPTNAKVPFPLFTQCNADYTLTAVAGGCYVINPTSGQGDLVGDCPVRPTAVQATAWTTVKSLYR